MMKRFFALLLCMTFLLGVLVSCDDTPAEPPATPPTTTPAPSDPTPSNPETPSEGGQLLRLSLYTVVYPENASAAIKAVAERVQASINAILPAGSIALITDDQTASTPYEILIGATNREASQAFYNDPGTASFVVRNVSRTLVLAGVSDDATDQAVAYFEATYLEGATNGRIAVVTDYVLKLDPNRIPAEVKDFGGYTFKIMSDLQTDYELQVPEEIGGSSLNRALVERNYLVENLYNVTIVERRNDHASPDTIFNTLKDYQTSGDYFTDLCSSYALKMIQSHAVTGFYWNVCDLESLRLDGPWWDQEFINEFKIADHLYTLTGDIQINDELNERIPAMNLSLYNETYPEKNFYDIVVKNGAWTWDEFYHTWNNFESMDGGTTNVVDSDDKVGYFYDCRTVNYMYTASDMSGFTFAEDRLTLNISSLKAIDICVNRMQQILDGRTNLKAARMDDNAVMAGTYEAAYNHFAAGKALFVSSSFYDAITYYGDTEDIVYPPYPKYGTGQEHYYSLVHMCFTPIAISANVADPERTALLTEALCYYSDALQEEAMGLILGSRAGSYTAENREILELTLNSKGYDFEYTANIMSWTSTANDLLCNDRLEMYEDEMDSISRVVVNTRGTGKLQNFLRVYAGLSFQ